MRAVGLAICLVSLVGFGGCTDDDETADSSRTPAAKTETEGRTPRAGGRGRSAGEPPQARQIRGWSDALNAGRYRKAASYFAIGAIVEQGSEVELKSRVATIAFNRALPCHAKVTEVEPPARDGTVVASFELRAGTGPAAVCQGDARVRFKFRDGKFTEWRQQAERPVPEGQAA